VVKVYGNYQSFTYPWFNIPPFRFFAAEEYNAMSDSEIKLYVQGACAEEAARELSRLIAEVYANPEIRSHDASTGPGEPRKIDPATGIAIAGLEVRNRKAQGRVFGLSGGISQPQRCKKDGIRL
jgi:hypothetical protein